MTRLIQESQDSSSPFLVHLPNIKNLNSKSFLFFNWLSITKNARTHSSYSSSNKEMWRCSWDCCNHHHNHSCIKTALCRCKILLHNPSNYKLYKTHQSHTSSKQKWDSSPNVCNSTGLLGDFQRKCTSRSQVQDSILKRGLILTC